MYPFFRQKECGPFPAKRRIETFLSRLFGITGVILAIATATLQAAETASAGPDLYQKVFEDLMRDAANGNAELAVNMGMIYLEGRGVEADRAKALEWFRKGAETGDPFGMANLGSMLFTENAVVGRASEGYAWSLLAYERFKPGEFKDRALKQITQIGDRLSREEIAAGQALFQRLRSTVPLYSGKY